ncbi:hypothetical protein BJX63DRAFT_426034 [Aspergillus granulosus]|uniref:Saccharopine dehydrogenase NADP binding domain-containing protein n=1 Tax=Aspergillus granulosus TaxID=176169 RepID=A0ABR4GUF9_9EURO
MVEYIHCQVHSTGTLGMQKASSAQGIRVTPKRIDTALKGITVLLNCAGPFFRTAEPLINACIRNKVHYLDIAAELDSYKLADKHDTQAKAANVMLLPGCGGSVAMLGCLASHAYSPAGFDNGSGPVTNYPVTMPDLITLRRSTKVPNIRTFVHAAGDAFPTGDLAAWPDGPTAEQRDAAPYHAVIAVTAVDGDVKRSVLHTVNGYTFTGKASVEGASRVFGSRFVEVVGGSSIKDF